MNTILLKRIARRLACDAQCQSVNRTAIGAIAIWLGLAGVAQGGETEPVVIPGVNDAADYFSRPYANSSPRFDASGRFVLLDFPADNGTLRTLLWDRSLEQMRVVAEVDNTTPYTRSDISNDGRYVLFGSPADPALALPTNISVVVNHIRQSLPAAP